MNSSSLLSNFSFLWVMRHFKPATNLRLKFEEGIVNSLWCEKYDRGVSINCAVNHDARSLLSEIEIVD